MTKHLILFKQQGEMSTTPRDPVAVFVPGDVDLTETVACCRCFDDFRLVPKNLYSVREVDLPDWMTAEEWLADTIRWKYLWGAEVGKDWPEAWQRGMKNLSFDTIYTLVALLKVKNFRSNFRRSLRNQTVEWLETAPEKRTYRSPLSPRQLDAITYSPYDAKRASERLYRSNNLGVAYQDVTDQMVAA